MGLESVELIVAVEDEFGISISDQEAALILTPRDMGDLIERKLAPLNGAVPRSHIDEKLRSITIREIGIDEGEYEVDAEYIRDFKMG